jgi:hypothetical protein
MSKKSSRPAREPADASAPMNTSSDTQRDDSRLEGFAEDLGALLAQARNKAESWLEQRKAIADHLAGVRDTATRLLAQLGASEPARRGRKPGSRGKAAASADSTAGRGDQAGQTQRQGGGPSQRAKKRTMSAEGREKIAAAQRARWARQKARK